MKVKIAERGEDERPVRNGRDGFAPFGPRCNQRGGDRGRGVFEVFDDPILMDSFMGRITISSISRSKGIIESRNIPSR